MARALSGSVSSTTACSGATSCPGPSASRAAAVCSGDHVVGVGAGRLARGQLEHLRAERSEHAVVGRHRGRLLVELVEVRLGLRQRLLVLAGLHHVDERPCDDADADEEALAVRRRSSAGVRLRRLAGRVHPEVEDAGGDRRGGRRREDVLDGGEQVAADVGQPDRGVAERLQLGRRLGRCAGVAVAQGARSRCRCR